MHCKVLALAVAAPERLAGWPDVPTFRELGYDIDFRGFVGLAAPAKTPKSIIDYLNKELNAVVQSEAFKQSMGELGMTVPVDKVGEITSLLTLVGGKAVYGAGPFAGQEGKL